MIIFGESSKLNYYRRQHRTPNVRFRKMAALPRVDNFFYFRGNVFALKRCEKPQPRQYATTLYASGFKNFNRLIISIL
jgi:hypothetical protein